MTEANKVVALKFIAALGDGDTEGAASCLAPTAVSQAMGFSRFQGVRQYETIVGTVGALKLLLPTGLRPEVKSVTAAGDTVVVEWEGHATASDGKPYHNQYCMVFTLAHGKIERVNEYFCTLLANEVLWPLVEQMSGQSQAS